MIKPKGTFWKMVVMPTADAPQVPTSERDKENMPIDTVDNWQDHQHEPKTTCDHSLSCLEDRVSELEDIDHERGSESRDSTGSMETCETQDHLESDEGKSSPVDMMQEARTSGNQEYCVSGPIISSANGINVNRNNNSSENEQSSRKGDKTMEIEDDECPTYRGLEDTLPFRVWAELMQEQFDRFGREGALEEDKVAYITSHTSDKAHEMLMAIQEEGNRKTVSAECLLRCMAQDFDEDVRKIDLRFGWW